MKIHCYNCQKQSQIQSSALKCPHCRSQAVQHINNQSQTQSSIYDTQFQRLPRENRFTSNSIFTDPFSMFRMTQFGGFGNSLFDDMDQFVRNRDIGNRQFRARIFDRMGVMDRNRGVDGNQPYYFRQIISNPHQTIIFINNLQEPEQYQIEEPQIKKQRPNISSLPKIKQLKQECPICNLKENGGVELPCKHAFHKDCLQPWLQIKDNCPCCRQQIL